MKYNLLILFSFLFAFISNSQTTDVGGPASWSGTIIKNKDVPKHVMPGFDLVSALVEDSINDLTKDSPWRFGHKYDTDFTLENTGKWFLLPNGDRIWKVEIECNEAQTINLLLEDVYFPNGAHLYLYDKDRTNKIGAYTARNNRTDGLLGTELIHGESIIVEYYEPSNVAGLGHFKIANVIHGYRSLKSHKNQFMKALNSSGDCNIDVNCPLGVGWEDQIRSVAMIVVNGNGYCSGALINNTCDDGTPYFLTANHCLTGGQAGNFVFRWNWESPVGTESCATTANSTDPGPPYDQTANGSTILVSGTEADHGLLLIDNMTLADAQNWGLFYAGWSNDDTESAVNLVTGIHHPSGDVKKICQADDGTGTGIIHAVNGGAATWEIDLWEIGVTEPGSSGSPLFDQNGRIIGQLYGGSAACTGTTSAGYDYYGRLGVSWGLGIGDYLAPASCGSAVTNDGWDPNTPTFDYTLDVSPESMDVCQQNDGVYSVNIGEVGGYSDAVTLSVSGLPAGATASFSTNPVTPIGTSDLTISNTGSVTPGTYTLTIEANSTSGMQSANVELVIGSLSPTSSTLITPTNGEVGTSIPTNFSWTASSEPGTTYSIEISSDANFITIVDQANNLATESYESTVLDINTIYYWRVQTNTLCGTSDWSSSSMFTTTGCLNYLSNDVPISIPANGTPVVTSTIDVTTAGTINDVNVVDLVGTHSRVKNLNITLQSPMGTIVTLMNQPCNNNHSDFDVDYDDQAASAVLPCAPIDGNAYQPVGLLADFNGEDALGTWTLTISDLVNNNGGELTSWSLEVCTDPISSAGLVEESAKEISIYPNPSKGSVRVSWNGNIEKMELTDSKGRSLKQYDLTEENIIDIDLKSYSSGVYFIHLFMSDGNKVHQIIKE